MISFRTIRYTFVPDESPETIPVASHADMRELLELATAKGARRLLARAHEAGLTGRISEVASDAEAFEAELGDLA